MFKKKAVIISVAAVVIAALVTVLILSLGKPKEKDQVEETTTSVQPTTRSPEQTTETSAPGGVQTPSDPDEIPAGRLLLSAEHPPSLEGFLQEPGEKIGIPGTDFILLTSKEANDWSDIPVPLVNPLGSRALYNRVTFSEVSSTGYTVMAYLDGFSEISQRIYGDRWELRIRDNDLSMNYIRWYALDIGATLYDNSDDRITFSLRQGDELWWATCTFRDPDAKEAVLQISRQLILPVGQTITITPADTKGGFYYFTTIADPGDFLSIIVEMESSNQRAEAALSGSQLVNTGFLTRRFEFSKRMYLSNMDKYSLNDIPQTQDPVFWSLRLPSGTNAPDKVTLRFEKSGIIEPVKIDDRFGSIRVVGTPGLTKISDQSSIHTLSHQDGFSYTGARDGEGNTIFYLPAGYYTVSTRLPGGGHGSIRMVPVNGGERTDVIIPDEFKATYSSLESLLGGFATNMGSISILSNTDNEDTAQTAILINDPLKRDVFPEPEHIIITEGGETADVLDIQRQTAPVNLVLVIDTSGSMEPYMSLTKNSAKRFVDGLPDATNIRLVSFSRIITEHPGQGKENVMNAIDTLTAAGSTAMYDATDKALSMLSGMDNAYIVIFSDGADSREPGVAGTGSNTTQTQIIQKIAATDVSVLTIGFSENHDPAALIAMSNANGKGAYFSAVDETMLDQAFAAVSAKFGNQFVITYKRPDTTVDIRSQEPVISLMIDDSGSMGAFRESVITLFYDFFKGLPEGSLLQLSKFGDRVDMMHITTDQKAPLLQAMGESGDTGSSTKVLKALGASLEQIKPLPTDKRVLIFLCDEAMSEISKSGNISETQSLFERFVEEGIRTLFIGVAGGVRVESSYALAAELTGGEYIITNDLTDIENALIRLLDKVSEPVIKERYIPFSIGIRAPTEDGSIMDYFAATKLLGFSQKTASGQVFEPKAAQIITGGRMLPLFDQTTAALINADKSVITGRVTYAKTEPEPHTPVPSVPTETVAYNKTGSNEHLTITVKESFTFDTLGGVEAQRDMQFTALLLELEFPDKDTSIEAYQIPSIFQHFYVSLNNKNPVPASNATWLTTEPLSVPGSPKISVKKGQTVKGMLVFYTEKPESIMQLGLHFYDTIHGHIQLPLTGKINEHMADIESLPQRAPVDITDAFSINITGYSDAKEYGGYVPSDETGTKQNTLLRTIESVFDSKVQALLKLDPLDRFFYAIKTEHGDLMSRMNSIVHNIPMGFTGNTLVAPGASNNVYMPYEIPEAYKNMSAYIFGDVKSSDFSIPVIEGPLSDISSKNIRYSHEYFDVIINDLCLSSARARTVVLDITIIDKKDGFSTTGIQRAFALHNDTESNNRYRFIEAHDGNLLYGIDQKWIAYDGQSRRGILLFDISTGHEKYTLRSLHIPELELKIENRTYPYQELLLQKNESVIDDSFNQTLNRAVSAAVSATRASRASSSDIIEEIALSVEDPEGVYIPAPDSSVFGSTLLGSIKSEKDFYNVMYALKWLPAERSEYFYSPEAVLSQEWGTQWDLVMTADRILSGFGIKTTYRDIALTSKGLLALSAISGINDTGRLTALPGLAYTDSDGDYRIFVIPFMRDISELSGLVYLPQSQSAKKPAPAKVTLTVTALASGDPDRVGLGQTSMFDAFSKAVGEAADEPKEKAEKEIILLSETMDIPALSLGAVDIGYFVAVKSDSGGDIIKAVVETTDGTIQGAAALDTGLDDIKGIKIHLSYTGQRDGFTHTTWLEQGQDITDVCHTLAFSLPEMSQKSVNILMAESSKLAENAEDANNASIVKWLNRSTIYRYIAARTEYDQDMSQKLGLIMGRVNHPMSIIVTTKSDGINALSTIDLMNHHNQIIQGDKDNVNAYRLLGGMHASILEGEAIADGNGINMLDLWQNAAMTEGFLIIDTSAEAREKAMSSLAASYPKQLIDNIQSALSSRSDTIFFVPKVPGSFNGQERFAWLEINSKTYDTISVFDTGERAGLAGYAMGLMSNKSLQGYIGFFIGVNCATWSISAYSLVMDDPQDVKDAAAMLCADILKQLKEMLGVTGSKGAVDYFGGKAKDNISVKGVSIGKVESILSAEIKTPGFVEGFSAAMEIYFAD